MKMKKTQELTIKEILDLVTGEQIKATDFFKKDIGEIFLFRSELEKVKHDNEKRYVCFFCKQPIGIRGKPEKTREVSLHFAHRKDSDECPIKTGSKFTKKEIECIKYNGAKESELHITLKNMIAELLAKTKNIKQVKTEAVFKDKNIPKVWKKPDISANYNSNIDLVIELQLSTTFLSVITSRQEFYKSNKAFILWVFNNFKTDDERRLFTQSDIYYTNNYNGFEFNDETIALSNSHNELILKCHYQELSIDNLSINENWTSKFIKINELTFNPDTYKVYYYDYSSQKISFEQELKDRITLNNSLLVYELRQENNFREVGNMYSNRYKINEVERKFILKEYQKEIQPESIKKVDDIEWQFNIILSTVVLKLNDIDLIERFFSIPHLNRVIYDILSLKLDKIIGYAVNNQKQILNTVCNSRSEYIDIYLLAINKYRPTLLTSEDKKGRLTELVRKTLKDSPKQAIENYDVIKKIFPDLIE